MSCHLRPGGQPFAGGLGLNTPFGVIYSSEHHAPTRDTGIGAMTPTSSIGPCTTASAPRARTSIRPSPIPWFTKLSRADNDAILAYLKTTPPVPYTPPANKLNFPFNIRFLVKGWNLLFFRAGDFQPTPSQTAEWNRGAFLVERPRPLQRLPHAEERRSAPTRAARRSTAACSTTGPRRT